MKRNIRRILKYFFILLVLALTLAGCTSSVLPETKLIYYDNIGEKYSVIINFSDYSEENPYSPDEFVLLFFRSLDTGADENQDAKELGSVDEEVLEKALEIDFNITVEYLRDSTYYNKEKRSYSSPKTENFENISLYLISVESKTELDKTICNYKYRDNIDETEYGIIYEYYLVEKKIVSTKLISVKENI